MLRIPFVVFIGAFGGVLVIYQAGWSDIYPALSYDTLIFFACTFIASGAFCIYAAPLIDDAPPYIPGLLPQFWTVLFLGTTFAGEIVLAGWIPILLVIEGQKFYALEETASHLHVFAFWSILSTIRFADFMYERKWRYLIEATLPIVFYGLLVYRGPALICLISWGFVFISYHRGLKLKHGILLVGLAGAAFYLNGLLGDIRSPGQENAGVPSDSFRKSGIPPTFFWTYLYATLGVANLQLSVDRLPPNQGTPAEFIASELLPDTISKRVLPILNNQINLGEAGLQTRDQLYTWEQPLVSRGLNVSTIFGRAYGFLGWVGAAIMFAALTAFIFIYLVLIRRSPYQVPCLALLNTLVVMCVFANMIASAAMLPLLVIPLLLPPWQLRGRRKRLRL